eukprot:693885-Rhodomonas_salina.2
MSRPHPSLQHLLALGGGTHHSHRVTALGICSRNEIFVYCSENIRFSLLEVIHSSVEVLPESKIILHSLSTRGTKNALDLAA